jgi:hypothetical protein
MGGAGLSEAGNTSCPPLDRPGVEEVTSALLRYGRCQFDQEQDAGRGVDRLGPISL